MLVVDFIHVTPGFKSGDGVAFFFNDTATTEIYTLSLHDALPISSWATAPPSRSICREWPSARRRRRDRKSTRLNSSHDQISYAVFCLKKKKLIHARESGGDLGTRHQDCRTSRSLDTDYSRNTSHR